jgi:membrane glycosyltransferase
MTRDRTKTAPVVAAGLVGGFAAARYSGRRELGGLVLGSAGAWSAWRWLKSSGPGVMGLLLGIYLAAFGVSHPLAKKIGAWRSVLAVTAGAAGAAYALADRSDASF